MVASIPFIQEARTLRHLMLRHPPGHTQRTAAYFLALGHYEAQLRRLRRHLEKRREVMAAALEQESLFKQTAAHFGGTSFWIQGPYWLDARDLALRAADQGILIEPGDVFFSPQTAPLNYFRLAYSSIEEDKITAGISLLSNIARQMERERARELAL